MRKIIQPRRPDHWIPGGLRADHVISILNRTKLPVTPLSTGKRRPQSSGAAVLATVGLTRLAGTGAMEARSIGGIG